MTALIDDRAATSQGRIAPAARSCHRSRETLPGPRRIEGGSVSTSGWRGPAAVVVVVVLLMMVGGVVGDAAVGTVGGPPTPTEGSTMAVLPGTGHIVRWGETYWSIAEQLGGDGDIRQRVAALEEANGGHPLQVGHRLVLPD